jgi:hypothetical protein
MFNPFAPAFPKPPTEPFERYLEGLGQGLHEEGALGAAGWVEEDRDAWIKQSAANEREARRARYRGQKALAEQLIATGRGSDIARMALRIETKSWIQKAEPIPAKSLEDYID